MQKIYIRNLGPINKVELDINKFNLLIGEQATGKSTIAKSIYFFRLIKTNVIDYLCQICDGTNYSDTNMEKSMCIKTLRSQFKNIFVRLFGSSWKLKSDMHLKYYFTDGIWVEVKLKSGHKQYLSVSFSHELNNKINELEKQVREIYSNSESTITSIAFANAERMRNHEEITRSVNEIFEDDLETYYIPAGRSLLTTMANSKSAIVVAGKDMDLVTEQFMLIIDNIRNNFKQGIALAHKQYPDGSRKYDISKIVEELQEILHGDYRFENGKEFLEIDDKTYNNGRIEINFASSGQQEILWLINYLYILILRKEKAFVIIEEPEAHIYPSMQKKVMELISLFANINDSKVLITTHSPYILNSVNNLYYAGVLCNENLSNKVEKIISKNKIIECGNLSAYKIQRENGRNAEVSDLFEDNKREIKSYLIDEISSEFNKVYTELYSLELDSLGE